MRVSKSAAVRACGCQKRHQRYPKGRCRALGERQFLSGFSRVKYHKQEGIPEVMVLDHLTRCHLELWPTSVQDPITVEAPARRVSQLSRSSSTNGWPYTSPRPLSAACVLFSLRSCCFMMPPGRVQNIQCPVVVAGLLPSMQGANGSLYFRTIQTSFYGAGFKMSRFSRLGFSFVVSSCSLIFRFFPP